LGGGGELQLGPLAAAFAVLDVDFGSNFGFHQGQ